MVFSSLYFVLLFMPLFFVGYYLVPDRCKNAVLLLGSLIFYFVGTIKTPYHFIIFIISIVLDFYLGNAMEQYPEKKKCFLLAGVCFHFICLGIFKYANFVFAEINKVVPDFLVPTEIILPIGISFYTFQGVSYLVDVYRGTVRAEKSLLRYAVYISMFEQLIAGPIVTYEQVRSDLRRRTIHYQSAIRGMGMFVFGLGLKVLLANPLGKLWTQTQTIGFESISTPLAWMAIFAYSFQLYFDFFGYSLMAMGLGRMLGFKLPRNFNHPYTSLTMTEFWRRWHMTLGAWFREYVYIPLGGNRNEAMDYINKDVDTLTNILAEQFYKDLEEYGYEGYGSLRVSYEVVTNTEKWFTLKICVHETAATSNTYYKYYHLDKMSGKVVKLGDLSENEDFLGVIENEIKRQMQEIMAADPNKHYWVDDAEIGIDFVKLSESHNFYWNEDNNLVIVFDKYEVAPGAMGTPKFTISRDIIVELLTPAYQAIF